ncbi:MAG: ParB/RepB/Spo0J family partition protein, partial [Bacteroidaceae bacterium]|nr:ParB/RepB/Spo0J family partition protein [Bacteroidaceae bacterium]
MKVASKLINIGLSKISPSPRNPRKTISETELDELAQNIRQQGLLQPITVRPVGKDKYEIVCGERRYKTVKKNADEDKDKKAEIACIVKEMTDDEAFDAMIAENLQRKDVDPMEEAFAFSELVKAGKSIDEIALRFGKNKRFVQERCKLNALITPLKDMTTKGVVPIAGAMMLSKLKEELQNTFNEYLADRLERDEELTLEVIEIKRW